LTTRKLTDRLDFLGLFFVLDISLDSPILFMPTKKTAKKAAATTVKTADVISIKGSRVHNLKDVSVDIPKNALVVVTGLSGSGKSSIAFDTVYAEGQRRYAESLSAYARQFLEMQDKPDVDEIHGLSPTIAIDQKSNTKNPRSTVGTTTEIYDHLRLLYARIGLPHCTLCGSDVRQLTQGQIVEGIRGILRRGDRVRILAPLLRNEYGKNEKIQAMISQIPSDMYRIDGSYVRRNDLAAMTIDETYPHSLEVFMGELVKGKEAGFMDMVEKGLDWGNGMIIVHIVDSDTNTIFSTDLLCGSCGARSTALEPRSFSFNSPQGACPRCTGLGITMEVDADLVIPNKKLTLEEGAVEPWVRITGNQQWHLKLLTEVAAAHKFNIATPVKDLSRKAYDILLYGTGDQEYEVGKKTSMYEGVIPGLEKRHAETNSDYIRKEIENYMHESVCPSCQGKRLKPEALTVTIDDLGISDAVKLSVDEAHDWFSGLLGSSEDKKKKEGILEGDNAKIAMPVVKEIVERLSKIRAVGLDYLTLDRSMTTLSGGEAQRIRLASQLSTGLTGVIYVLDEPSVGMHPQDISKLVETLTSLRNLGNTVIVVEHDAEIMAAADFVIDVGPGAGVYGGEIIAQGTLEQLKKDKNSMTGQYLSGKKSIDPPKKLHKGTGKFLQVIGATQHNLDNVDLKIPLGKFVAVSGVSGSGKSTLVLDILGTFLSKHFYRAKAEPGEHKEVKGLKNIDKVISIDQSPIGRTPRSNPATYTGLFTIIRDMFTEVPEAKARGYDAGKFSFNVRGGGRCEACAGEGYVRIPMQFLTDVFVECDECHGKRYNREALEIHYRDKDISDVLKMTVEEAKLFFSDIPNVSEKLRILSEVGLGYVQLGQPATTLSGGEAQRVKLATELSRRSTGKTLYILDEPTTGLHFDDIKKLLGVLMMLVEKGNTVLVIEHNVDVIRSADWVIDMGPGGGKYGGQIVAEGTPSEIKKTKASVSGKYLK